MEIKQAFVIEYHYTDGDIGAHPFEEAENIWDTLNIFAMNDRSGHKLTHLLIRPVDPEIE